MQSYDIYLTSMKECFFNSVFVPVEFKKSMDVLNMRHQLGYFVSKIHNKIIGLHYLKELQLD